MGINKIKEKPTERHEASFYFFLSLHHIFNEVKHENDHLHTHAKITSNKLIYFCFHSFFKFDNVCFEDTDIIHPNSLKLNVTNIIF